MYCASLRKQPTFHDITTGFPAKWCLRNECRNSILITCWYPDLGSASDLLNQICPSAWPIRSTTQATVVQTLDSTIHRINHYPSDKYWGNWLRYSTGQRFIRWIVLSTFWTTRARSTECKSWHVIIMPFLQFLILQENSGTSRLVVRNLLRFDKQNFLTDAM